MSSGQMPHPYPYSQPRYPRVPPPQTPQTQLLPYQSPYSNTDTGYHSFSNSSRQPSFESGFRFPYSMPGYSSLTNSALVDALLTPDTNEQEQQRRDLSLAASFHERPPQMKRLRPGDHDSPPPSDLGNEDDMHYIQRQDTNRTGTRPSKQQKRKLTASVELEDDYVDNNLSDGHDSLDSIPRPRRSARSKKAQAPVRFVDHDDDDDCSSPQKETKPKKATPAKKARKERPGRLIRKKPIGTPVPKTLSEAGPPDRMMWQWKNQGKNWEEIRAEWKRLTGVEPGGSSLSVRYIKLVENLARNGAAGDLELLRFKREAEEELMSQLWVKVAEKMLTYSSESEHNPKDLQKRYNMIVRSGYDIEKLLADDERQRETQQNQRAPTLKGGDTGNDFDLDFNDIAAYDDPVANETAAGLKSTDLDNTRVINGGTGYEDELPAVSADSTNLFDSCGVLRTEVDGLNERRHLHNIGYAVPTRQQIENVLPRVPQPPTTTFTAHKGEFDDAVGGHLPFSSSLVGYSSDSE